MREFRKIKTGELVASQDPFFNSANATNGTIKFILGRIFTASIKSSSSCMYCYRGSVIKDWSLGDIVYRELDINNPALGVKKGIVSRIYSDKYHSKLYEVDFGEFGIQSGLLRHGINQYCNHEVSVG